MVMICLAFLLGLFSIPLGLNIVGLEHFKALVVVWFDGLLPIWVCFSASLG